MALYTTKLWESGIDSIDYSIPMYEESLQMLCAYNYTGEREEGDLFDTYLQFHWSCNLSLSLSFFFLAFSWSACVLLGRKLCHNIRQQLDSARLNSFWIVTRAFFDQDQFPDISNVTFSALGLLISLLFFVAKDCFMLNLVSTDLVVIKEPPVIRSYQDAVERENLRILLFSGTFEETFFRGADEGTLEHNLWNKVYLVEELSPQSLMAIYDPVVEQRMVSLVRDWLGINAAVIGITKSRMDGYNNLRALATKDESSGKRFTVGFMIRRDAPVALRTYSHRRYFICLFIR